MPTGAVERLEQVRPDVAPLLFVPRSEEEYQRLVALLDSLIDRVGEDERHPLASLMDLVGVLIERYEEEQVPELTYMALSGSQGHPVSIPNPTGKNSALTPGVPAHTMIVHLFKR